MEGDWMTGIRLMVVAFPETRIVEAFESLIPYFVITIFAYVDLEKATGFPSQRKRTIETTRSRPGGVSRRGQVRPGKVDLRVRYRSIILINDPSVKVDRH